LKLVDALAQRWHLSPSDVLAENAGLVMAILGAIGEDVGAEQLPPSEDDLMRGLLVNQSRVSDG